MPKAEKHDDMKEYRNLLIATQQRSQDDYDKTVLALSGGALGITFAFVRDIIGSSPIQHPWLLFWAWITWAISITIALYSFFFSQLANRKAIKQLDEGRIHQEAPGGFFDRITALFNILSGLFFLIGVVLTVLFVARNFGV